MPGSPPSRSPQPAPLGDENQTVGDADKEDGRSFKDLLLSGPKIDNVDEIWPARNRGYAEGRQTTDSEREPTSPLDRLSFADPLSVFAVAVFAIAIGIIMADIMRLNLFGGLLG